MEFLNEALDGKFDKEILDNNTVVQWKQISVDTSFCIIIIEYNVFLDEKSKENTKFGVRLKQTSKLKDIKNASMHFVSSQI